MKKILSILLVFIFLFFSSSCRSEKDISSQTSSLAHETPNTQASESQVSSKMETVSSEVEVVSNSKVSEASSAAPSSSQVPQSKPNNTVETISKINPKVIASICQHSYNKPSCTAPLICSKCSETGPSEYEGEKITYNHVFVDKKCIECGYVSTFSQENMVEFGGEFYETNKEVITDILLLTEETNVSRYLNITFYKYENNTWQPYEGFYEQGEYFGLVATPGEVLISENGIKYGRWDYLSNEILQKEPSATVESDFSEGRLIRRFKIIFSKPGIYRCSVGEGKTPGSPGNDYVIKTFVF